MITQNLVAVKYLILTLCTIRLAKLFGKII